MPSKKKNKNKNKNSESVYVWNNDELVDVAEVDEEKEKTKITGSARRKHEKHLRAAIRLKKNGKSYAIKKPIEQQSQINDQVIEESPKEEKKELSNSPAILELIHSKIPEKIDQSAFPAQEDFATYKKRQEDAQRKVAEMKQAEEERRKKLYQTKTSQIPGMGNFDISKQSPIKHHENIITDEEMLKWEEKALENLLKGERGTFQQISSREDEIALRKNNIDNLKLKLGLTTQEEIDARKAEEKRQEKENNKERLRNLERQLSAYSKMPDVYNDVDKLRRELEISAIKKEIERLQRLVPENERLPIEDENEQNLDDEIVEQPNENVDESVKEDIKEDVKEDTQDKNEIKVVSQSQKPSIDDFYTRLDKNMTSDDVTKRVKSEITDIIKAAGINDDQKVFDVVEASYAYVKDKIQYIYDPTIVKNTKTSIDALTFFYNSYESLYDSDLKTRNRIIVAQKIADVMLKNYSPVAFANGELDQYASNYVVNDRERLKGQLEDLRVENIDTLVNEVEAVLAGKIIEDPEPEKVEQSQPQPQPQYSPQTQYYYAFEDDDGLIDSSKPDEFERRLEAQQNLQNTLKKEEPKQTQHFNAFDDDDFIDASKPDAFERNLEEKQRNEQNTLDPTQILTTDDTKKIEPKLDDQNTKKENVQDKELDLDEMGSINDIPDEPAEEATINNNQVDNKQDKGKVENVVADNTPKIAFFTKKLAEFGDMYNINVDVNDYASYLGDAWALMKDSDAKKQEEGKKMMGNLFKSTLKAAFTVEKETAYKEHRLPDFSGVVKSSNDLLRAGMFAFTDLYHNPKSASLFAPTSFGGLTAKEMAALTAGKSSWSMDQKSDAAWEIQSKEAKALAAEWEKEPKPYEKLINEMNALAENAKGDSIDRSDAYKKLTAAEWLLTNNKKMMIDDPEDPLNPMPNWGNRYWKAITNAREALGIPKHTSMRDLIQGDYAEEARAACNPKYTETQIQEQFLDADVRQMSDSIEAQKEQFTLESSAIDIKAPQDENIEEVEEGLRWRLYIKSEDEREKIKNEPKVFSNLVISKDAELKHEKENTALQN